MADIGWITGHSYIVYGPLALAATTVLYEGVPNYPDAGRPWRIAEQLDVNIFHTSPTAIRMLRKAGPDEPAKYNYHFKHMTTVGEPIEPDGVAAGITTSSARARRSSSTRGGRPRTAGFSADNPGPRSDEAGQRRSRRASEFIRSSTTKTARSSRQAPAKRRQHLHPEPVAGHHADHLGRSRSFRRSSTTRSTARTRRAKTGATGRTSPPTARCSRRTAISAFWVASTTSSTWPAIGSARRSSSRRA